MALRDDELDELDEHADGTGGLAVADVPSWRVPLALAPLALGGVQLELLSGPFATGSGARVHRVPHDADADAPSA